MQGFAGFTREGIELPPNFTATVNAELRVGAIEESVTVSGATPLVDTQNVARQTVLGKTLRLGRRTAPRPVANFSTILAMRPASVDGTTRSRRSIALLSRGGSPAITNMTIRAASAAAPNRAPVILTASNTSGFARCASRPNTKTKIASWPSTVSVSSTRSRTIVAKAPVALICSCRDRK